jgi:actin related protein 2/3 complex subunit 2
MILLETGNRMLGETVASQINAELADGEQRDPLDVRLCDFDDVSYRVTIEDDARNILLVSMAAPCIGQIMDKGAKAACEKHYGSMSVSPVGGMDVTIKVDLDNISNKGELIQNLSLLKPNVIGAVFGYFFERLANGDAPEKPFQFALRGDTTAYIFPAKDRVVIIYTMHYDDKAENCIAKVFMQEFVDTKKKIGKAPPVSFSTVPPREMQEQLDIKDSTCNLGYLSFAVLKPHVTNEKKRAAVNSLLLDFRTYMQYHIKCSKSYFHSRMRARCAELLKVLSRAKVKEGEDAHKGTVKRTAAGKVFSRK